LTSSEPRRAGPELRVTPALRAETLADRAIGPRGQSLRGLPDRASGESHRRETGRCPLLDLLENEAHLLAEVNHALARIERGPFGRCENGGREIPRERLEALPYARYCLRCARELQAGARE
jgi:RNA polymerase-binding transcription factor DksA